MMNATTTKYGAILIALSLTIGGGAAYASGLAPQKNIQAENIQKFAITVDNQLVKAQGYQNNNDIEPMVPLRDVLDILGVAITWNKETKSAEFNKGPIWTSVQTGKDQYVFGKMYKSLGTAPVLKDGKIFVPASFFSSILSGSVSTEKGNITINFETPQETATTSGIITEVNKQEDGYSSVKINGAGIHGLVLNVGDHTVYEGKDGATLSIDDLAIGQSVEVVHSLITTFSLPPQTPTYRIKIQDEDRTTEWLGTYGTIEEKSSPDSDHSLRLRIKGTGISDSSQDEVILRVTEDTSIIRADGSEATLDELSKDSEIVAFYSPLLTRSLPPIGTAGKLILLNME